MKLKEIGPLNITIIVVICVCAFALGLVSLASREQFIEWKSHPINFGIHVLGIAGVAMLPLLLLVIINLLFQLIRQGKINKSQLSQLFIFGTLSILLVSVISTCILWFLG